VPGRLLEVHTARPRVVARALDGAAGLLAVQNFGGGRSAAFTADTTWQWNRNERIHALGKDSPYQRFWGQMVRYLANVSTKSRNAGTQVLLRTDRRYMQAGATLALQARVQGDRPGAGGSLDEDPELKGLLSELVVEAGGAKRGARIRLRSSRRNGPSSSSGRSLNWRAAFGLMCRAMPSARQTIWASSAALKKFKGLSHQRSAPFLAGTIFGPDKLFMCFPPDVIIHRQSVTGLSAESGCG